MPKDVHFGSEEFDCDQRKKAYSLLEEMEKGFPTSGFDEQKLAKVGLHSTMRKALVDAGFLLRTDVNASGHVQRWYFIASWV